MSDVVLLRKLTLKSTLNFGKFADLTVQQCINTKKRKYLRWVYFNCSNITFMDELLDELKIPVWYRFDKPNKNPELGKKLKAIFLESTPEWLQLKVDKKAKRLSDVRSMKSELYDDMKNSKINLMNRNRATKNKYN